MVYGVAEAAIDDVWNVVEKAPLAPIVALTVELLMVMETSSLVGGNFVPALMVPEREIEGVPCVMVWDGARPEKTAVTRRTDRDGCRG